MSKTKNTFYGTYTGLPIPNNLKTQIDEKNGKLYYKRRSDNWYATIFQGEHGIYDFNSFQHAISWYFKIE